MGATKNSRNGPKITKKSSNLNNVDDFKFTRLYDFHKSRFFEFILFLIAKNDQCKVMGHFFGEQTSHFRV